MLNFMKKLQALARENWLIYIIGDHGIEVNIHGTQPKPRNGHQLLGDSYCQALLFIYSYIF